MQRSVSDFNVYFGRVIRNERNAREWTQETLAWHANLNRNYISLIERGERSPSLNTLRHLSAALETPVSELLRAAEGLYSGGLDVDNK